MNSLTEFVDYVWSFYGNEDPLYPIEGLTKKDIVDAFNIYIERIEKGDLEYVHYSWGDGDSLDRERVRDIILENPKFTLAQESIMIKVGTNVKSKIHDDLTGHVVVCEPINNYAVIMTDIIEYEMMTVECFLSDLEVA